MSDPLISEARISALHLADGSDQLWRWAFRAGLATPLRCEEQLVLASNQGPVEAHDRRRPEHNRRADQLGRADHRGQKQEFAPYCKLHHTSLSPEQARRMRRAIANYRKARRLLRLWEAQTQRLIELNAPEQR